MRELVKKAALPLIALALAVSATGCAADTNAQADRRKQAKAETAYYGDQVGNSDDDSNNDIETYDRWRQLFGSQKNPRAAILERTLMRRVPSLD